MIAFEQISYCYFWLPSSQNSSFMLTSVSHIIFSFHFDALQNLIAPIMVTQEYRVSDIVTTLLPSVSNHHEVGSRPRRSTPSSAQVIRFHVEYVNIGSRLTIDQVSVLRSTVERTIEFIAKELLGMSHGLEREREKHRFF